MWETNVLSVEKNSEIIAFSYKELGSNKIYSYSLQDLKPKELALQLHKVFDEADILIAHNGDNFDIKTANSFFAKYNLTPPSPYKTIDTLKIARNKFKFNSNKLNDLGEYLGLGSKVATGGFKLWLGCIKGNNKSWGLMKKYNKQDVVLLEKVYLKLRPWAERLPFNSYGLQCPTCGSDNIQLRGWNVNTVYKTRRFQCQDCGHFSHSNIKIRHNDKEYLR
jgi:DNA polymerase elongation subunit (family B)